MEERPLEWTPDLPRKTQTSPADYIALSRGISLSLAGGNAYSGPYRHGEGGYSYTSGEYQHVTTTRYKGPGVVYIIPAVKVSFLLIITRYVPPVHFDVSFIYWYD